jgi:hypothetical protein
MPLRRVFTAAATLLLLAVPVATARAQEAPSSLPFHAGQWGLSANVTAASAGIGALRFTAPSHAVVLDASFSVRRNSRTLPSTLDPSGTKESTTETFAAVDLGFRRYRSLSTTAALFHTFGVNVFQQGVGGGGQRSWGAGIFGDLGGQYMLDPRFSLGVSAGLSLGYSNRRFETGLGAARDESFGITTTPARLIGSVYF